MTVPAGPQKIIQSRPRNVQFVMRDGESVQGGVYLNEGQSLAPYLGSRKGGWLNIVNATWLVSKETSSHAVIQADHVFFALSLDGDVPMYGATSALSPRDVVIALEDNTTLRGVLQLAEKQRLCDYLTAYGKFIPVLETTRSPSSVSMGDIALNSATVRSLKDAKVFAPGTMEPAKDVGGDARATPPEPVRRAASPRSGGTSAGRSKHLGAPTRAAPIVAHGTPPLAVRTSPGLELTPEQRTLDDWLSRHWLVQMGAGAQLLPPDPRGLPPSPSLEQLWHALAERNDMADAELGVLVAAGFKLPVANLDGVQADALEQVPARVARKLNVLPLHTDGKVLHLAVSDPSSMEIEQQVGFVTRQRVLYEIAPPAEIRGAIDWHYAEGKNAT